MADSFQSSDSKSLVLAAVDLVQLVSQTVRLVRAGRDFKGLCPFHQEKTPSFTVSPSKQFFYCYGCKEHGNAIDFVMKRDRLPFLDAMKLLADQHGIALPKLGGSPEQNSERLALLDALSTAAAVYQRQLMDPVKGKGARDYLAQRGFRSETLSRFQVGYSPESWDFLLTHPQMRKFSLELLQTAGLVKRRDPARGSGFYDTFRNRIIFPIRDEQGRVIAFGGRVMPGSADPAKYLNSPETPLFSKGRCIYGLDLARQQIVQERTVVVVEGYTDVVIAHQAGEGNVVSVLGTALTEPHLNILKRFADRVVLLFDADAAGDAAVLRAVELFLSQPLEVAIASMPPGKDPDEFILENGGEAFRNLLAGATDALSYLWKQVGRTYVQREGDLTSQQRAVSEYLALLAKARLSGPVDDLRWGAALQRVGRLTGLDPAELRARFGRGGRSGPGVQVSRPARPKVQVRDGSETADQRAAAWIIGILLEDPSLWSEVQTRVLLEDFPEGPHRRLAELYWNVQRDEGEVVFSELISRLDPECAELAIRSQQQCAEFADPAVLLRDAMDYMTAARRSREEQARISAMRRTGASADEVELLKVMQERARVPDLRRTRL